MTPSPGCRTVTLSLNGKTYHVEIEDLDRSPLEVRVDGRAYQVVIEEAEREVSQAAASGTASTVAASRATAPLPAVPAYSSQVLRSPMPGNILDIAVAVGDTVKVGQPLCALEAMKMKSSIRSPREGVIAGVHVAEGQVVVHGELLFTFE